jgi:predicted nucleotidyltransferase
VLSFWEEDAMMDEMTLLIQKAAFVLKAAGARDVYVFGSARHGTLREGSDVDLAVSRLPPEIFFRAIAQASRAAGRPLDLVDLDQDTPFVRHLKIEGELQRVG